MTRTVSGVLTGGLPFDRLGAGPRDVVVFPGLAFENKPASRIAARALLGPLRFLERDFTVHVVYRRPQLPPGSTIATMADDYAAMIRSEFGGPVDLVGVSTGGSIALQLAVDHPELVRRLGLYSTAHRLGETGRRFQRRQAELARDGRWGTAMAEGMALILLPQAGRGQWLTLPVRWLLTLLGATLPTPRDPSDFVTTIQAEDTFDLGSRLGEIRAPTLVVGGARDPFYTPELFQATADGIGDARLVLDPRGGHVPTGDHIAREILGFLEAKDRTPETGYEREAVIGQPPERVFDFCSDLRNELVWNPDARSVEKLTDGPVGIGTTYRARWARTRPTLVEVVGFDRPRSWTTQSRAMGMWVTATGTVEQHPDGTRYRVRLELRPAGLSWLLAPVVVRMMERQEGRNMARIRAALESADSPALSCRSQPRQ